MNSAINTGFYLPFGLRGVSRRAAETSLIQDLICYSSVAILTDQMQAVPRLVEIMGEAAFEEALDSGAIRFIHDRQMLAWPALPHYRGVLPFHALATQDGFTQESTRSLVRKLLEGSAASWHLGPKIERVTGDFGQRANNALPSAPMLFSADLDEALSRFVRMLEGMEDTPLTSDDIRRLQDALRDPKRSPLTPKRGKSKLRVMSLQLLTGVGALAVEQQMPPKQLMMLNLVLAERFLEIHRTLGSEAILHTEPIVESALTVEAERIRFAVGKELDTVLRMKNVYLPVLETDETFPFRDLLVARRSSAAESFRRMVATRDADGIAELAAVFCDTLSPPLRARVRSGLFKILLSCVPWGPGGPVVALAEAVFGEAARIKAPAYFIDHHLRRIGVTKEAVHQRNRATSRVTQGG